MPVIELSEHKWGQVMACMAYAPGRECIGLLNEMSAQLTAQIQVAMPPPPRPIDAGNSKEATNGQ
jgi:hypothetical protein